MRSIKFNLTCNNVKGLQWYKKRLKIFEYLTNKKWSQWHFFFWKKHIPQSKIRWNDNFNDHCYLIIYCSHVKSTLCDVLIVLFLA